MQNITKVNLKYSLVEELKNGVYNISVTDGRLTENLGSLSENMYEYGNYGKNKDYLVIFSNKLENNHSAKFAFDLNNGCKIDLSDERILTYIENMFIEKWFDLAVILSVLNPDSEGLVTEGEKESLINFISSNNKEINENEITEYILEQYPELNEYRNLSGIITAARYRNMINRLGLYNMSFYAMPQRIEKLNGRSK